MKRFMLMLMAFVFGMSMLVFADDDATKPATKEGRKTDTYGYERSNEVNKGKQGEAMREKNAKKREEKKEAKAEAKESKKEAKEAKKEMKAEKHNAKGDK